MHPEHQRKGFSNTPPHTKTQLIQSKFQPLLEDKVEPTKILRAINIIFTTMTDKLNKIMTPTGFLEFLTNLDSRPTEFKYGKDAHGSNLEYDYRLKIHHNSTKRTEEGWVDQPGAVLIAYLEILIEMPRYYRHTARLNPSPENSLEICSINMLDAKEPLDNTTASQYLNNQQQTDSGYIKSFEIWFTTSYNELGLPPRSQTIEGPEARKYNPAQQRDFLEHTK